MKKIDKRKKRLSEKTSYDNINNADSMWSRMSSTRKAGKAGKDVLKILDIEDDGPDRRHRVSEPLSMMDLVFKDWEGDMANGDAPGVEDDAHVELDDTEDGEDEDE